MSNIQGHIYGLIAEIAAAEKITKVKLSILSRDILGYVMETDDIQSVNRLLEVLTPVNKRVAVLFFSHFLPWDAERTPEGAFVRFGKRSKGEKKLARSLKLIKEFLADVSNNIWTWADENVETDLKKKDFGGMIQRAVAKALEGDEKTDTPPLDREAILAAIFAGGVSIEDMMEAIDVQESKIEAEMAAAEAIMQEEAA